MDTPDKPLPHCRITAGQLTQEEKISLTEGYHSWQTAPIERLGIRSLYLTDGPHGIRKVVQAGASFDIGKNEVATAFPTASAIACSWNPANAYAIGAAIAHEARNHGVDVVLAPGVNIVRDPRCGRAFEYYSEDPLVSAECGSAFVQGMQNEGICACVKHFALNSNESYRFVGDSRVDERALREIYLRAFERIVKTAHPHAVISAYNKVNGTYCSENALLLHRILRDEWGFDGLVITDWGATNDRVAGLKAGCDLDMPGNVAYNRAMIRSALRNKELSQAQLDESADRILQLVARHEQPTGTSEEIDHAELACQVATESAVLLKNDGALPLDPNATVAVVGDMFENLRFQGAGSSLVTPPHTTSARQAFDARHIRYTFARGYRGLDTHPDAALESEAVAAAAAAETVLFFAGLTDFEESEGFDRANLDLPTVQVSLLHKLVATGTPVVVILHTGCPVTIPSLASVAAVLDMHLGGMESGEAAARLIFGECSPSGKLAVSWPLRAEDCSAYADFSRAPTARYYESIYVGYRFYDKAKTPLQFPFGYGLSYTTFEYSALRVSREGSTVRADVTVTNTGSTSGTEIVQLYTHQNDSAVFKPLKELRAFAHVELAPGQHRTVTLRFPLSDLAYWDIADHGWRIENGTYQVMVGASSADIRLSDTMHVSDGSVSRSPYPAAVDHAYAMPPRIEPDEFCLLADVAPPAAQQKGFTFDTRLADGRHTAMGAVLYHAIVGAAQRKNRKARALPPSPERDALVKNSYFTAAMMPTVSLRSMAMASSGRFPLNIAHALAEVSAGHVRRALAYLKPSPDPRPSFRPNEAMHQ